MSICSLVAGMPALNCSVAAWPIRQTLISTNQPRSSYHAHSDLHMYAQQAFSGLQESPWGKSHAVFPGRSRGTALCLCTSPTVSSWVTCWTCPIAWKLTLVGGVVPSPCLLVGVMCPFTWVVGHVWLWSRGDCTSPNFAHSNLDGSAQKGSVVFTECLLAMSYYKEWRSLCLCVLACMEVTALPVSSLSECWAAGELYTSCECCSVWVDWWCCADSVEKSRWSSKVNFQNWLQLHILRRTPECVTIGHSNQTAPFSKE